MAELDLGGEEGLRYEYRAPGGGGLTFVGFNPLTGDLEQWEAAIGEAVRAAGHGTLFWNYRGQTGSPAAPERDLGEDTIVADALALGRAVAPPRPVLVGLSIGGLFAARAFLEGLPAEAIVLVNTLRRPGPRLDWINDAVLRCAELGGSALVRDLYAPLLFGEAWLAANRAAAFPDPPYEPIERGSGAHRLLADARSSRWDFPWERLTLPVLVVTGEQDRVFRDPADVEALVARLPDARRVDVPEGGHLLTVEHPDRIRTALLDFAGTL